MSDPVRDGWFTPGPWEHRPDDTNIICETESVGCVVGDGWNLALIFADGEIGCETANANARLIAAAPDMLAALKECVWLLADLQAMPGLIQKHARAAIAKAKGQTP